VHGARRSFAVAAAGALAATGCVETPSLGVAGPGSAARCGVATSPGVVVGDQLAVTATATGATAIWLAAADRSLVTVALDRDGLAHDAPTIAWPGRFDTAAIAAIDDQVVVAATAGITTSLVNAPFGVLPYHELALVGGVSGASPLVAVGVQRIAASVSDGGLLVNGLDAAWAIHTSALAVLTPRAREVAVASIGSEAAIVWSTAAACYLERVFDPARGAGTSEPGACPGPRLAARPAAHEVGLVFERDGAIYFTRGAPAALHPARAIAIADGASPRIVAVGGAYWISYLDLNGRAVAGLVGSDGALRTVGLDDATTHDLAVVDGAAVEYTASADGLTASTLCAE
jgi:hypothetical protein